MKDRRYLLNIKQLLDEAEGEALATYACKKLDQTRLAKVQKFPIGRKRAEAIGAGLLLQIGLQEMRHTNSDASEEKEAIQLFSVAELLAKLEQVMEAEYIYGENGKPYFKNLPVYFNLSHSGDYVFCVFSEEEVGVDVQNRKAKTKERIVKRFFTSAEQSAWEKCVTEEEREYLFYKFWTRKEAYGKLTGEGIVKAASVDVTGENGVSDVVWDDFEMPEGYWISICRKARKKE